MRRKREEAAQVALKIACRIPAKCQPVFVESPDFAPAESLPNLPPKRTGNSPTYSWTGHPWDDLTAWTATWDNPTMTLTADSKKRVVLPGAAPGDVFTCEQKGPEMVLRRIYHEAPRKKLTKAQALKAIRSWKALRGVKWEELRAITREP